MIDLKSLVNSDNEVYISKEYWKNLNETYSKDEIKKALSDAIETFNIDLPYMKITKEECLSDFQNLIDLDAKSLFCSGKVFTRYDYSYEMSNWYIDLSNVGSKSSNYFHQEARWKADSINAPSPYRTWTTERFRLTLFNALWSLKFEEITMSKLRSAIGLRKYIAGQFRPSAAKAMYELFSPKIILDPSAGWGDRLSAYMAYVYSESNTEGKAFLYDSCDPNTNINYSNQITLLKRKSKNPSLTEIEHVPFEQKVLSVPVDFAFTSPPYFNIEKYSKDVNQSYLKYKKFDDWLNWFLNDYVKKMWDHTKPSAYMAINISDVYSGHKVNNICDPMNDFILSLGGEYIGTIGLRMPKRPNSKAHKDGIFVEPIWIWKKPRDDSYPYAKYKCTSSELDDLITKHLTQQL